jgi:hypothetical protein
MNAGQIDSASLAVREAMQKPTARTAEFPFLLAGVQATKDPVLARRTLRDALDSVDVRELGTRDLTDKVWLMMSAGDAATATGGVQDMQRLTELATSAQPEIWGKVPTALAGKVWGLAAQLAMGVPPKQLKPSIDAAIRAVNRLDGRVGQQSRYSAIALPYMAYLMTHDRSYAETVRQWWNGPSWPPLVELDAMQALDAGDTAAAVNATKGFPSADSVRAVGAFVNGMRWYTRGEVFERLGDARRALSYYEVLEPSRLSRNGALDPGMPLYARSFLLRGHLYEGLGDRVHAEEAYSKFLELWKDADPALRGQLREARDGLARVRGEPVPDQAK